MSSTWTQIPTTSYSHGFFESDFSNCFYILYLSTKEHFLESQRFSLNTKWLPRKVVIDEPLRSPPMAFACSASHPRPWGSSLRSIVFLWNHMTKVGDFTENTENPFIFSLVLGFNFPYNVIYEKMKPNIFGKNHRIWFIYWENNTSAIVILRAICYRRLLTAK